MSNNELRQKKKKGRSVQDLMGIKTFTRYGIKTNKGELLLFLVSPTNISVMSRAAIEAKINNMPYVLESLVLQKDTKLVALVCPDFEAVDADHLTQTQLEVLMEENRKLVNQQLATYEQINEIRIFNHEFEKTPKKSIKRFLYEA